MRRFGGMMLVWGCAVVASAGPVWAGGALQGGQGAVSVLVSEAGAGAAGSAGGGNPGGGNANGAQAGGAQVGGAQGGGAEVRRLDRSAPVVGGGEIRRSGQRAAVGEGEADTGRGGALWEMERLLVGLALVLGLILAMRFGAAKWLGLRGVGAGDNRGVRVLSRTLMGPRQQLVLLQVGRKLVLVSDSGGRVTPVTEVVDADEVAELTAQALGEAAGETRASEGGFASLLGLKAARFGGREAEAGDSSEPDEVTAAGEAAVSVERMEGSAGGPAVPAETGLSALAERVRGLSARMAGRG